MKRRFLSLLVTAAILAGTVLLLWWNADHQVQWEQERLKGSTNGPNAFELVFRWNQVGLNPFTWKKPCTDKLVLARSSEIKLFNEEGKLVVPVLVLLNTRALKLSSSLEANRFEYHFDFRAKQVAMVPIDIFGVSTEKPQYEPLKSGTQAEIIRKWAEAALKREAKH